MEKEKGCGTEPEGNPGLKRRRRHLNDAAGNFIIPMTDKCYFLLIILMC